MEHRNIKALGLLVTFISIGVAFFLTVSGVTGALNFIYVPIPTPGGANLSFGIFDIFIGSCVFFFGLKVLRKISSTQN